ncbi:hypothetical protein pb186bvf_018228 [Paramecium bursaria]
MLTKKKTMGGCGSRDKDIREKLGLPQQEFDRALQKFNKISAIKPGNPGVSFTVEGLKSMFPENPQFAAKMFKLFPITDFLNFLIGFDLFARLSIKIQNHGLRNYDQITLFALVSFQYPDLSSQPNIQLQKISVTYSMAGKMFKELINMQSSKGQLLCKEDDLAPILLINTIFENHVSLDLATFLIKLKSELPQVNKIIKQHFQGKFFLKSQRIRVKDISSELLPTQLIGLFNLATPWFLKAQSLQMCYKYDGSEKFNFNKMANSLLGAKSPVIILFRHKDQAKEYVFGFFCSSYWRLSPDISGDRQSFIFSLTPRFKIFSHSSGEGQSKFALINPIITRKSSQHLSPRYKDSPGLGIGGSGYEQHRIWIDGRSLQGSWIKDEDKTFQPGSILGEDVYQLKIDNIEIWQLQVSAAGQSTTFFKSVGSNSFLSDSNMSNTRELNSPFAKRQILKSVPIIQEEEEDHKVQQ